MGYDQSWQSHCVPHLTLRNISSYCMLIFDRCCVQLCFILCFFRRSIFKYFS
uniref:Uncharacterized protein n=1 Tax=Anguilla anguilla TaxID=7936 RepID=A0A0E9RVF0_ANGAN